MSVVFVLVFAAILMASGFLVAFIWSVKSGQYDDTYTPSVRILFDDAVKKDEDGNQKSGKKSQSQFPVEKESGDRNNSKFKIQNSKLD